mmetsp:Transcript_26894/g.57194  ORF Transcript_26894/g.57194 Transcript_26894/m.57194 type:complete len:260 (+) Transcript_26894:275-1054(+)
MAVILIRSTGITLRRSYPKPLFRRRAFCVSSAPRLVSPSVVAASGPVPGRAQKRMNISISSLNGFATWYWVGATTPMLLFGGESTTSSISPSSCFNCSWPLTTLISPHTSSFVLCLLRKPRGIVSTVNVPLDGNRLYGITSGGSCRMVAAGANAAGLPSSASFPAPSGVRSALAAKSSSVAPTFPVRASWCCTNRSVIAAKSLKMRRGGANGDLAGPPQTSRSNTWSQNHRTVFSSARPSSSPCLARQLGRSFSKAASI